MITVIDSIIGCMHVLCIAYAIATVDVSIFELESMAVMDGIMVLRSSIPRPAAAIKDSTQVTDPYICKSVPTTSRREVLATVHICLTWKLSQAACHAVLNVKRACAL
jgi:hypothetical protein